MYTVFDMRQNITQKLVREWLVYLSQSQGFYGRFLRDWDEANPKGRREVMKALKKEDVNDIYDFVIWMEN